MYYFIHCDSKYKNNYLISKQKILYLYKIFIVMAKYTLLKDTYRLNEKKNYYKGYEIELDDKQAEVMANYGFIEAKPKEVKTKPKKDK